MGIGINIEVGNFIIFQSILSKKSFMRFTLVLLALLLWCSPIYAQNENPADQRIDSLKEAFEREPSSQAIMEALGRAYAETQSYEAIVDLIKPVIEDTSTNNVLIKLYVGARIKQLQTQSAGPKLLQQLLGGADTKEKKLINRVMQRDPEDAEAQLFLAELHKLADEPVYAENIYRRMMKNPRVISGPWFVSVWTAYSTLLIDQERFTEANSILTHAAGTEKSSGWFELQMAQVTLETGETARGTRLFFQGLDALRDESQVHQLFEEAWAIAARTELEQWNTLNTLDAKKDFLRRFWSKRTPNLADSANAKLAENYKRLRHVKRYYARRTFPGYDERGLVFMRMGKPDHFYTDTRTESWVYESANAHFDFVDPGSGYYEMRPLTDALSLSGSAAGQFQELKAMMEARRNLHPFYEQTAARLQAREDAISVERSRSNAFRNIISETEIRLGREGTNKPGLQKSETLDKIPSVSLVASYACFKGKNKSTRVDFYYMIPIRELQTLRIADSSSTAFLFANARILDTNYREITTLHREFKIAVVDRDAPLFVIDELRTLLQPGTYILGLELINNNNERKGVYRFDVEVRDFIGANLSISDIQPAVSVTVGLLEDKFIKPDTRIRVVPFAGDHFDGRKPLSVYYEINNLTRDLKGVTSYEISYTLAPAQRGNILTRAVGKLFGSSKATITSVTQKTGTLPTEREYVGFDISELPEGECVLTITVKDLLSGQTASSERFFWVNKK